MEEARSKYRRVGALGFCLGGGLSLRVAARTNSAVSVVSFYGEPPTDEETGRISYPMLAIPAARDEIINTRVPSFVGAAMAAGKDLTL